MNWYKKAQQLYRGDTESIDISDFDSEHGTKNLRKELGSSLAQGPGIYFSTQENDAALYGEHITKKQLSGANILTKNSPLFTYAQIDRMLRQIDKDRVSMAISNWDENYSVGKKMLMDSIVGADNPIDQIMGIWTEVFNHQDPNSFMNLMKNNGIDGISIVMTPEVTHYIIYNRDVLQ